MYIDYLNTFRNLFFRNLLPLICFVSFQQQHFEFLTVHQKFKYFCSFSFSLHSKMFNFFLLVIVLDVYTSLLKRNLIFKHYALNNLVKIYFQGENSE